jgi:hypothetical protein
MSPPVNACEGGGGWRPWHPGNVFWNVLQADTHCAEDTSSCEHSSPGINP